MSGWVGGRSLANIPDQLPAASPPNPVSPLVPQHPVPPQAHACDTARAHTQHTHTRSSHLGCPFRGLHRRPARCLRLHSCLAGCLHPRQRLQRLGLQGPGMGQGRRGSSLALLRTKPGSVRTLHPTMHAPLSNTRGAPCAPTWTHPEHAATESHCWLVRSKKNRYRRSRGGELGQRTPDAAWARSSCTMAHTPHTPMQVKELSDKTARVGTSTATSTAPHR